MKTENQLTPAQQEAKRLILSLLGLVAKEVYDFACEELKEMPKKLKS